MPATDIEGEARRCWEEARGAVRGGVRLECKGNRVTNNLPKAAGNRRCHVRPHAGRAYYRLADGYAKGENLADGSRLPDSQWTTRQSFWLNSAYVAAAIAAALEGQGRLRSSTSYPKHPLRQSLSPVAAAALSRNVVIWRSATVVATMPNRDGML